MNCSRKFTGYAPATEACQRRSETSRPCLNYHIHQCNAPCQGYISKEEYRAAVNEALAFLGGNYDPVLKLLEKQMMEASEKMDFEAAIVQRDLLNSVKQIAQKQKITNSDGEDKDIMCSGSGQTLMQWCRCFSSGAAG